MRYGMVPLEFGPVVDKIIVNGMPDFSRFDIIEIIRDAVVIEHIELIELTMDIMHIIPNAITEKSISEMIVLKDELNHAYTVHLPLWSIEPASFNEHIRKGSIQTVIEAIDITKPLEPEAYVLHATGPLAAEFSRLNFPPNMVTLICGFMASFAAQSVEEVLSRTEIDPRLLAIENIEFPFALTRDIVDEYDTGICFDTGHLLAKYSGDESVLDFYKKHKDRIVEFHLHDGGYQEIEGLPVHSDHIALGRGEMPVKELLSELVKDNFSGPIIFELSAKETLESFEFIRTHIPEALN